MLFTFVVLILWGSAFLFLFRIPTCPECGVGGSYPTVSVIVPARNEEHNLPRLLDSLFHQSLQPYEVIVVDDESADRTAAIAAEKGAYVIPSKPLPEGWRGKTWACAQGAKSATGDVLLFVDADTFFEQEGMRRILDVFVQGRGALSVAPYHRVERWYEELSAFFNILMTAGVGAFALGRHGRMPAGFFGPFLMVDRAAYHMCGGHEAVCDKILENYHFARVFQRAGVKTRCLGGKGAFGVRMYPDGLAQLIEGWTKAFASGAAETPAWIVWATILWISGAFLAWAYMFIGLFLTGAPYTFLGVALYLLYVLQVAFILRKLGSFRFITALAYPIPLLFYQGVFARSLLRKIRRHKVSWKGREIDADSARGSDNSHAD